MLERRLLERAFEIAKSGCVLNTAQLRRRLRDDGYTLSEIAAQLDGRQTGDTLRALMKSARQPG